MKVRITRLANRDLDEIGDWIATGDPFSADSFMDELNAKIVQIGERPLLYPLVQGREARAVRRRLHRDYLIFYDITGNEVRILRVLHGSRDYTNLL